VERKVFLLPFYFNLLPDPSRTGGDVFTIFHILFAIPSHGFVRKATTTILQNPQEVIKMKKRTLVVLGIVLSLSIIVAGSAMARQGGGYGMMGSGYDRGYGNCNWNDGERSVVAPESMAKFQKETLPSGMNWSSRGSS
jgi:hypothetical protein